MQTHYEKSTHLVRRLGKDEEEKMMPSFSPSSFDISTFATAIDVATEDAVEVPAKDGSEDEAADETMEGNGIFHERWTEEVE